MTNKIQLVKSSALTSSNDLKVKSLNKNVYQNLRYCRDLCLFGVSYLLIDSKGVVVEEWWVTRQHFVDQDPQGPPIHSLIVALALDDFGGQIFGGPAQGPRPVGHPLCETKVRYFEVTLSVKEQVFRFEVTVNDGQGVEVVQGGNNLHRIEEGCGSVETSGTGDI